MSVTRSFSATSIKVYDTDSEMQAEATGDLTQIYTVVGGVIIDPNWPAIKYNIEIYQDDNSVLHGRYRVI